MIDPRSLVGEARDSFIRGSQEISNLKIGGMEGTARYRKSFAVHLGISVRNVGKGVEDYFLRNSAMMLYKSRCLIRQKISRYLTATEEIG